MQISRSESLSMASGYGSKGTLLDMLVIHEIPICTTASSQSSFIHDHSDSTLIIRTWFWNRHHIRSFIVKAHNIHHDKTDTELHIYNHTYVSHISLADINRPKVANWEGPVSRPSRPWSSVILPGTVKQDLLKDVKDFISEEEKTWYSSKGQSGFSD
jgi:hypothetical protein